MRIILGFGVNEDRIAANIARRKAVAEKRDEAQAFLANIPQKIKEKIRNAEEVAGKRDYAQMMLKFTGKDAQEKVKRDKYEQESKLGQYGFYLQMYYAIEYLIANGMKDRSFKKAFKNYKTALNELGESLPEKSVEKMREMIFEDDDGVGFSNYRSFELNEFGIADGKARKNTSFMLNKKADYMRSLINKRSFIEKRLNV
jgi:hypothetical protein